MVLYVGRTRTQTNPRCMDRNAQKTGVWLCLCIIKISWQPFNSQKPIEVYMEPQLSCLRKEWVLDLDILVTSADFLPPHPTPNSHIQHCRLHVKWELLNPLKQGRRHLLWQFLGRLENQVSVCHQRLYLPCVMMISILLPWRLSDSASLFICRTFSVVSKNRCGLVEHSTATTFFFFYKFLWLWWLLPTFQMSPSLLQGLFVKDGDKWLTWLFFSVF